MDIKTKKIYHCASQDDVRQFLTQAKNKGFVWKNERKTHAARKQRAQFILNFPV